MEKKAKGVIIILIGIAVLFYVLPIFYETFNYYPPMKEDMPHRKTVQIWNTFINQRVTLDTEIPSIPVDQFPVYKEKSSSSTLNISFTNSSEFYNNHTGEICFLIANDEIAETTFNLTDNAIGLEPIQIVNLQTAGFSNPGEYIIQKIRNREFVTQNGNLPMFPLGRIRITDVKLVYFNGFDTYSYRYEGQTTYYPAWKVTAETSNYGDEVLMIKAF